MRGWARLGAPKILLLPKFMQLIKGCKQNLNTVLSSRDTAFWISFE